MRKLSILQTALILAAGYSLEDAKSCPSAEINKMTKNGTLVIIPALVGAFSMSYAIFLITQIKSLALLGGLVWSIILFFFDRSLVSNDRPGTYNLGMLGRFLFAIIIGFVVAEPVVLLTFNDAIQEEINKGFIIEKDKVSAKYAPEFLLLDSKLSDGQKKLDEKNRLYVEEADGTGGSGNKNKGPIFDLKYNDYQKELVVFNELKEDVESEIIIKTQAMNDEITSIKSSKASGLLGQFRALHSIDDPEVTWATWCLRLFFFFIEIIPFLIKISPSRNNPYYDLIDFKNKIHLEIMMSNSIFSKELAKSKAKSLNQDEILKNEELDIQNILKSKEKNVAQLSKKMYETIDNKLKQEMKVAKNIKDKEAREKLIKSLNSLFEGYFKTIEDLAAKATQV